MTLKTGLGFVNWSLKIAPFDRPYTTFYWSAIVNIAYLVPFLSYSTLNDIVTLKFGLKVTETGTIRKFGAVSYSPSIVTIWRYLASVPR